MRTALWVLAIAAALPSVAASAAEGSGMTPRIDSLPWGGWQGRLSVAVQETPIRSVLAGNDGGLQVGAVGLMGDYYFGRSLFGLPTPSGLHATSGLLVGPRAQGWAGQPGLGAQRGAFGATRRIVSIQANAGAASDASYDSTTTIPYLGFGYSGQASKSGWSFSADLGWVALAAGNVVKFGRVFSGTQGLDDVVRDKRVAPVMQLGVSYSF